MKNLFIAVLFAALTSLSTLAVAGEDFSKGPYQAEWLTKYG
jgi:hypothetical protein